MVNYRKSVIYKIIHFENSELCYIGSTVNFKTRKCRHKNDCHNENGKHYKFKLYKMIRDNGGWAAFRMVVIEEFPCESKTQLCIREEEVRVEYKANMNSNKSYSTADEKKEYKKKYNFEHRVELNEKAKQNYIDNREEKNEHNKQYYDDNKDDINKKRNSKVTCECGCIVNRSSLYNHKKTYKHLNSRDETPT